MKPDKNDKLDELLFAALTREKPEFDFDNWKREHQKEIDIFKSQTDSRHIPQPAGIWRIIMKSRMTKFATAAMVIVGVFLGAHYLGAPIDGASVTWAQVVEQMNSHERYACRMRVTGGEGPLTPVMKVYHLNLSQRRQELEDGTIQVIDMRGEDAMIVELHPAQKKAIVTKLAGFGPKKDPDIIEMVKQFDQESVERLGTRKQDNKTLYGFRRQPDENNEFTVWVDTDTKLPVEVNIKHLNVGQTITLDEFEYDFQLDPSAFSTEVPDGYKVKTIVNDYRPVAPKEIVAEDIQRGLNHAAYAVGKLPWMENICTMETVDPLGSKTTVYVTGIQCNDENMMMIVQGNYYDLTSMVWVPKQQLVLESPGGVKCYTHPNGAIYAQLFFESFAKAKPDLFDIKNLSGERSTRVIVMPDGTILTLSANKQVSNEKLQELIESLTEIKP